jgi:cell division protein FtsW
VLLLANVAVLNAVGLVFVLSSSSVQALEDYGTSWFFFAKQLQWALIAIAALLLMSRVDYHRLRRFAVPAMFVSLGLLAAVQVPGVGVGAGGATRWLGAGPVRFQPSEVAKFALVLYLADLMTRRAHLAGEWRRGVQPLVFAFLAIAFLVMLQPDLGTTLALGIIFLAVILIGGVRWRHLFLIVVSFAAAAAAFSVAVPWRRRRLFTFLDPWKDTGNAGYQVAQSFIAVASGRWTGTGLGAGRAKWSFLPNAHNDFIFAIIAEEVGFVGCALVLALFGIFAVLGIRTALKAPDRFGCLLAAGITAWVVGQAMVNIATVVGLMPVTGVPLPFISFGGTALVIVMAAVGVLLSVARQAR